MTLEAWLLFCATETLLCFTPGPAVLLVVSRSLTEGPRAGAWAIVGILAANTTYFALSATSLGAVLAASQTLFAVVKWVGAVYLLVVGIQMVWMKSEPSPAAEPPSHRNSFAMAVVTQAANPKALVFFTAILPQFIDPTVPVLRQILILGASSFVIEVIALSLYVATSHTARTWIGQRQFTGLLQRLGGLCLIVAGARLALARRI